MSQNKQRPGMIAQMPVQEKIAELERRLGEIETKLKGIRSDDFRHPQSTFAKICDVFFNGRRA